MNHTSTRRRAALSTAVAVAALLSAGPTVSAATAAPHAGHQAKHGTGHGGGHGGGHGQHPGAGHRDRLGKLIAKVDAALVRVQRKAGRLGDVLGPQVAANVEADRTALAALTTRDQVDAVRPEVYQTVISDLRWVTRLQARLAEAADGAAASEAGAAADAAVQTLLGMSATTSRSELRGVKREISAIKALVQEAEASGDEPGDDDPTEPEPGDDDPTDGDG